MRYFAIHRLKSRYIDCSMCQQNKLYDHMGGPYMKYIHSTVNCIERLFCSDYSVEYINCGNFTAMS